MVQRRQLSTTKKYQYTTSFYSDLYDDIYLYAVLIRSPISSGTIRSISLDNIPEGYKLFTADDLPNQNPIKVYDTSFPVFAKDKISYIGEPIGALVGPNISTLHDLLDDVKITYTEIFSPKLEQDATKITAKKTIYFNPRIQDETNIYKEGEYTTIDTEDEKISSPIENYAHKVETHSCLHLEIDETVETNGAFCSVTEKKITINTPTQWAWNVKQNVESITGFAAQNIVLNKTKIQTTEKNSPWLNTTIAVQCAVLSVLTKKSILLSLSQTEQSLYNDFQNKVNITHISYIDEKGTILHSDISIKVDVGAYNPFSTTIADRLSITALGPYKANAFSIDVSVYTSENPPTTSLLRWLDYHAFFAIETHLKEIAHITDCNSADIRLNNLATIPKDSPFQLETKNYKQVLENILTKSDYYRKHEAYKLNSYNPKIKNTYFPIRGIGLATAYEGNGYLGGTANTSPQSVEVTMEKNGTVTIKALNESNTISDIWKGIASSILSVDKEDIIIDSSFAEHEDLKAPDVLLTNMYMNTQLIKKACTAVQKLRFREALPISAKRSFKQASKKTWDKLTFTGKPFYATSWIAVIAEIELIIPTYSYNIRNVWISIDAGNILNKKRARYAIQNSVKQIISNIITHNNIFEPNISINFIDANDDAKQIRELVYSALPSAIANALSQTLKHTLNNFPVDQKEIFRLIEEINKNVEMTYIGNDEDEEKIDETEAIH